MTRTDNTLELLQQNWQLLSKSVETLGLSVEKCLHIKARAEFSFEEMESIDSLTSKFSRTSDIFTQKVLRGVWALLHEPYEPFIDFMNKAEKLNIIYSADELLNIRDWQVKPLRSLPEYSGGSVRLNDFDFKILVSLT